MLGPHLLAGGAVLGTTRGSTSHQVLWIGRMDLQTKLGGSAGMKATAPSVTV